jgi:hypothetical protein
VIYQVIENSINVCVDLGIKLFSWEIVVPHPLAFHPNDPFNLVGPVASGIVGILGKPLLPDRRLRNYEDVDVNLEYLLHERIVFIDKRWHASFGLVWSGEGGLQGVLTSQGEDADRDMIKKKWGEYVHVGKPQQTAIRSATPATTSMSIRVKRKSHLVSKR